MSVRRVLSVRTSALLVVVSALAAGVVGGTVQAGAAGAATTAAIRNTTLVGLDSGRCLDLLGGNTTPGAAVGTWACTPGAANQRWTLTPAGELTTVGGVCLDDPGFSTVVGTKVKIWSCNGGVNERWKVYPSGEIVNQYSRLCLEVAGSDKSDGAATVLATCNGAANQKWTVGSALSTFKLPVRDQTFESTTHLWDGGIVGPPGNGWTGGSGVFNPDATYYSGLAGGRLATGTMSGETVGYLWGASPAPLRQTLTTSVQRGMTYRLVVAVGGRSNGSPFAGAGIDLLVGGKVVATKAVQAPPVPGSFGDVSVTYSAPATASGSGALGIAIRALTPGAASYVDVDNVRLFQDPDHALTTPLPHQVVQREPSGNAGVVIAGRYVGADTVWGRLVVRPGFQGVTTPWLRLTGTGGAFSGRVTDVRPGWYDTQVLASGGGDLPRLLTVGEVGIGEIFIIAGQSNSANWGESPQTPGDPRVSATNAGHTSWQFAQDPQPNADGGKGSAWPAFGTRFAQTTGMPVAVISVGVGSTSTAQWQPGGDLYQHLQAAIQGVGGFRAVLWHQGETDASGCVSTATYIQNMRNIIDATRRDAGYPVSWGVARASYLYWNQPGCMDQVDAAQAQLPSVVPGVFAGPNTNGYHNQGVLWDTVHFSNALLTQHGNDWVDALRSWGGVPAA